MGSVTAQTSLADADLRASLIHFRRLRGNGEYAVWPDI